jgi:hypothetical protein
MEETPMEETPMEETHFLGHTIQTDASIPTPKPVLARTHSSSRRKGFQRGAARGASTTKTIGIAERAKAQRRTMIKKPQELVVNDGAVVDPDRIIGHIGSQFVYTFLRFLLFFYFFIFLFFLPFFLFYSLSVASLWREGSFVFVCVRSFVIVCGCLQARLSFGECL